MFNAARSKSSRVQGFEEFKGSKSSKVKGCSVYLSAFLVGLGVLGALVVEEFKGSRV